MTFRLFGSDIDFSFAVCSRRQNNCLLSNQDSFEGSSHFQYSVYDSDYSDYASDDLSDSCRSVTFADNIVSEVISVPRLEEERISELFWSSSEMCQFKHEARMERSRVQRMKSLWGCYS
mmetsp:Transcript_15473/g.33278  ORF Transcript_15473/g.33278 Transcript_15473/m.33278 type:complete len:119 (+) Transcript_15473:349-705(+)